MPRSKPPLSDKTHHLTPYRGYNLRTWPTTGTTLIYYHGELVDSINLRQKGMHQTTISAAKDLVDSWLEAK